jgi:hypothetical protein
MPTKPGGLLEGFKLEGQTQTLLEVLNSVLQAFPQDHLDQ